MVMVEMITMLITGATIFLRTVLAGFAKFQELI